MKIQSNLLIEIGMEELPPKALVSLRDAFKHSMISRLFDSGIKHDTVESYATPRRLGLLISDVAKRQPDQTSQRRGPSIASAFDDDGNFTNAAIGFARRCGVPTESLDRLRTDKGEWLFYTSKTKGFETKHLLPDLIHDAIMNLPAQKRMVWGDNTTPFVRPVHWLVVILGDEIVDMEIFGIKSGRFTRGHRFHSPDPILIDSPESYSQELFEKGWVIADHDKRMDIIEDAVRAAADSLGGVADMDKALVNEVAALVEWPVTQIGRFDERFLSVPAEALISSMKVHQKYFPVHNRESGRLLPFFIMISNINSKYPEVVVQGNERVIRPRLADAEFFWAQDCEKKLSDRINDLRSVTYQKDLGNLHEKSCRVAQLAASMSHYFNVDSETAVEAAMLAKCDLMTAMVGEFPELQGVMGRHYSLNDGNKKTVSIAMEEQYLPRFAGDKIPASPLGALLGCADRLDTLVGIFSIGSAPTGDKDPYALRRSALAIIRILIEGKWKVSLVDCLNMAAKGLPSKPPSTTREKPTHQPEKLASKINFFMADRLKSYYIDLGYTVDQFEAVRNAGGLPVQPEDPAEIDNLVDFDHRLQALRRVIGCAKFNAIFQINKRIHNILKKNVLPCSSILDKELLLSKEENALYASTLKLQLEIEPLIESLDYVAAISKLTLVESDLVSFFDEVMVMDKNPKIRTNRLNLLILVYAQLNRIIHLAYLDLQ